MLVRDFVLLLLYFSSVHCVWKLQDLLRVNYNPHRPPLVNGTEPVQIFLKLEIVTILDVNEFGQSFTVDLDYRLTWNDYRLHLPQAEADFPLIVDLSWKEKLWIPDIYFKNALNSELVQGTINPISLLEINRNSDVSLNTRMTVKLICDMELFAYPHDKQRCFLDSTSLSYDPTHVQLSWDSFTVDETIYFPKFKIDSYSSAPNCNHPNIHGVGSKSCIRAIVNLSRKVSFYVTRIYAPTILITSATFLGYYIDLNSPPGRVAINLTPLLSLITMHNIINSEIKVSYVVALHIWMFVCMFFTFIGLMEYFLALAVDHIQSMREKERNWFREQEEELERQPLKEREESEGRIVDEKDAGKVMNNNEQVLPVKSALDAKQTVCWVMKIWQSISSTLVKCCKRGKEGEEEKEREKGKRKRKMPKHHINPVDAIARPLAPMCYVAFIICYFHYFQNYSNIHDTVKTVMNQTITTNNE